MFTAKENHKAVHAEIHFNRSMASAAIECGKYISPTDSDIKEAYSSGPEWDTGLPIMEVEEFEVISIDLSDYPLPENPTSYDWWWA